MNCPECTALSDARSRRIRLSNMSRWLAATTRSPSVSISVFCPYHDAARRIMMVITANATGSSRAACLSMKMFLIVKSRKAGIEALAADVINMQAIASPNTLQ
jgi:hypothetical protein